MKKRIVLIIAAVAILIFALVGCTAGPAKQIESTQKAWDEAKNKEATDNFVVKDVNLGKLIVINNVEANLARKFEDNKVAVNAEVKNIAVTFSKDIDSVLKVVTGVISGIPALDTKKIQDNIGALTIKADITLTDLKVLKGSVEINGLDKIIDGQKDKETIAIDTTLNYGPKDEFSVAIGDGINFLLSHFGATVFNPAENGKANFNPAKLNEILKAVVDYSEEKYKDDPSYTKLSEQIKNIAGVDYDKILTEKVKVVKPTFEGKFSKGLITEMTVGAEKIQVLYNKTQFGTVAKNIVALIPGVPSGITGAIDTIIGSFVNDVTKNESCIEIGKFEVKSTYTINK